MAVSDESMFLGERAAPDTGALLPQDVIAKAVSESRARDPEGGKVMKVLYLDDKGESVGEWASSQIPENPFAGQMSGLQEPPFRLEQLLYLAESHPVHSAAIEQKTVDITGKGWSWEPLDDEEADEETRDLMEEWFQSLAPDDVDMHEVIHSAWLDVETVGWGLIEVARDPQGIVQRTYHVPGHTVRAHRDGFRLCQIRDARKVWFRRWGAPQVDGQEVQVDARSGSMRSIRIPANDLLVIKKPARRSTWYGIPGYISAVGYITLALAARDDNLFWFANRREPRWAIVLSNLADDPNLQEDLRRAFVVDMRQPYRNLMIPIQGPGKVEFNKLSDTKVDGSFAQLAERADKAVMIGHRVPAERLANSQIGPLGGNSTAAASRVYKDGVVSPGQELLSKRLNRFIEVEWAKKESASEGSKPKWKLAMDDLDIDDDRQELDMTAIQFHGNMITLGEARAKLGLGPLMKPVKKQVNPDGTDYVPPTGASGATGAATGATGASTTTPSSSGASGATGPTGAATKATVQVKIDGADAPSGTENDDQPTPNPEGPDAMIRWVPVNDPETGKPLMVESEYNDMLFTELPGSAGTAGTPGTPPVGAHGLSKARNERSDLDGLEQAVRTLYASAREGHEGIERLATELQEAVEEQRRGLGS